MNAELEAIKQKIVAVETLLGYDTTEERIKFGKENVIAKPYRKYTEDELKAQLKQFQDEKNNIYAIMRQSAPNQAESKASSSEAGVGKIFFNLFYFYFF